MNFIWHVNSTIKVRLIVCGCGGPRRECWLDGVKYLAVATTRNAAKYAGMRHICRRGPKFTEASAWQRGQKRFETEKKLNSVFLRYIAFDINYFSRICVIRLSVKVWKAKNHEQSTSPRTQEVSSNAWLLHYFYMVFKIYCEFAKLSYN